MNIDAQECFDLMNKTDSSTFKYGSNKDFEKSLKENGRSSFTGGTQDEINDLEVRGIKPGIKVSDPVLADETFIVLEWSKYEVDKYGHFNSIDTELMTTSKFDYKSFQFLYDSDTKLYATPIINKK